MLKTGVVAGLLLAVLATVPLTAQEQGPSPVVDNSKPVTPARIAKANLYVYRHRRYEGSALKPSVYVDENEVARIENGRFFVSHLDAGKHSIRSNDKASGVDIDMKPGTDYYIRIDMQTGFWKGHGRLTLLLPEQGEYEVKQTKPLKVGDIRNRDLVAAQE